MDKVNYNSLTSSVYGFNYCWIQDGGEIYHDRYLSMIDFPDYFLWHWGNEIN